jgi:DNA-binding MarR family transcriptional regulator
VNVAERYLTQRGAAGLFARLTRLAARLEEFHSECFSPFGLRSVEYATLRVLELAGEPYALSPSHLAEVLVRSSGGVTQIVDRLEKSHLVERFPDSDDGRRVMVSLTREGLSVVRKNRVAYEAKHTELLATMSEDEINAIAASIGSLLELFGDTQKRFEETEKIQ